MPNYGEKLEIGTHQLISNQPLEDQIFFLVQAKNFVRCQLLACFVLLTFYLPVITIHIGTNNSNFHKIKETCYTKKCLVQSFNSFLQPLQPSILMTMLDELVDKFSFLTWRYPKQGSSCSSHALAPSFNF